MSLLVFHFVSYHMEIKVTLDSSSKLMMSPPLVERMLWLAGY